MKSLYLCFAIWLMFAFNAKAYCTPDNDTCFECGTNCVAELTYTKDENSNDVGTLTVYGTGEKGSGQMQAYGHTGQEPYRTTTAPWKDKLSDINNVVISEGVINVGIDAFSGAQNISHLELPESVSTVGAWAFLDSTLETVNTLKNVTTLGKGSFYGTNLSSIDLSDELESIERYTFGYTNLKDVIVPDSVTSIDFMAFYGTSTLQNIELGDGITTIGSEAFIGIPSNAKLYCHNIDGRCDRLFFGDVDTGVSESQVVKYTIDGGYYLHDGQRYRSLQNMQKGVSAKRIYTLKEANEVSGKKNSVIIRYK